MSFFEELTKIGVESVKDGVLGFDDKDRVNKHFEEAGKKRPREEGEGEEEEEEEAEKLGTEHVSPDTCELSVEETPTEALGILESALADLGYSVENITDSASLSGAWKRALLNEMNKNASKALKKALIEVVRQHPDKAPAIMKKIAVAKATVAARRAAEASR